MGKVFREYMVMKGAGEDDTITDTMLYLNRRLSPYMDAGAMTTLIGVLDTSEDVAEYLADDEMLAVPGSVLPVLVLSLVYVPERVTPDEIEGIENDFELRLINDYSSDAL